MSFYRKSNFGYVNIMIIISPVNELFDFQSISFSDATGRGIFRADHRDDAIAAHRLGCIIHAAAGGFSGITVAPELFVELISNLEFIDSIYFLNHQPAITDESAFGFEDNCPEPMPV